MKTLRVKDIMYSSVFSISQESSAYEASLKMKQDKIGSVLVKDKKEYVGIVTTKDIAHRIVGAKKDPEKTKVNQIMSSPIVMIEESLPIHEAVNLMTEYGIKRLVVKHNEKVVGIISARLVLKFINSV